MSATMPHPGHIRFDSRAVHGRNCYTFYTVFEKLTPFHFRALDPPMVPKVSPRRS